MALCRQARRPSTLSDASGNNPVMADRGEAPVGRLRTGRMEAFSDGVFAIAITLLVLEITVPNGSENDLLGAVGDQWPSYLAYAVSFSTIGAVWLAHVTITDYLDHANAVLLRLNLLLLMVVSFLPFPTRLLAGHLGESDAARVAATVYGVTLLAAVGLIALVWRYAVGVGLLRQDAASQEIQTLTARLAPGLGGYVLMIVVGLFLPTVAIVGYLTLAVVLMVPFELRRHRTRTLSQ
jgi:uncharacterized membrane protein